MKVGLGALIAFATMVPAASALPEDAASPGVPPWLPPSVRYYAPPPIGAPAEPPVPDVPTVIGVGNVPGLVINPHIRWRPPIGGDAEATRVPASSSTSSAATTCEYDRTGNLSVYSHALVWKSVSLGNPSYVQLDPYVHHVSVPNRISEGEHTAVGLLDWQHKPTGTWVQMGYARGYSPTWTDTLPANQVMIYMELNTETAQNWVPLLNVNQATRHTFRMTQDATGHYYSFYLDGALKWANVYQRNVLTLAHAGNEVETVDGYCDGGYADVNASVPAFNRYVAEPGLAVGRIGNGPWSSFATSPTRLLATFGYVCGLNSNGYNWSCGPAGAFPT